MDKSPADHIAACITNNRPIDRAFLTRLTGLVDAALESLINQTVCAFVMESQGSTGAANRRSGMKRETDGARPNSIQNTAQ